MFYFTCSSNAPPRWSLWKLAPGGLVWTLVDRIVYGDTYDNGSPFASGTWLRARRTDLGGIDYGDYSNNVLVP